MILESGDLDSGGELLTEQPGDGWTFLRVTEDTAPKLTIRFGKGRGQLRTYELERVGDHRAVRISLRRCDREATPDDPRHLVVLPVDGGGPGHCTCDGYRSHKRCKHGAAIRAVIAAGLLP